MKLHSQDPADAVAYNIVDKGVHYRLSRNFKLHEFQSNDGSFAVLVHPALSYGFQKLRDDSGGEVYITSAHRTHAYNLTLPGAADESRHLYGMAGDVKSAVWTPPTVQEWAEENGWGGIGYYHKFTHLDVQGKNRRWGPAL